MNMLPILALVAVQQPTFEQYMHGWWIITGDRNFVTFALRSSIQGPPSARRLAGRTIASQAQSGLLETRFTVEIDCLKRRSRYINLTGYGATGTQAVPLPKPSQNFRPITPKSNGEYLASFACETNAQGDPPVGYLTMLPTREVADQTFRFIGLGLDRDAAAALAAIDARRAPKAFNDLLQVLVTAARQPYVRAIKIPEK